MAKPKLKSAKTITKEIKKDAELSKIDNKIAEIVEKEPGLYDGFNFNPVGRPTKYNSSLIDKVFEFIRLRVDKNHIPTIEGLGLYLNLSKDTIYAWKEKHKKFSYALDVLMKVQGEMLQMNGLQGWYNPTITQLLLKNNHGYHDKHEIDHTSDGERIEGITYTPPAGADTADSPDLE